MQEHQLRALDAVVAEQVATKQGWATLAERVYRVTSNRAVFDFATEIYTVQWVMQRWVRAGRPALPLSAFLNPSRLLCVLQSRH
jgi:hypothetical protein